MRSHFKTSLHHSLFLIIFFTNPLCSGTAETLLVRTTPRLLQARVPGTPRTRSTQHCSTRRTHLPHTDNRNLSTRMHRLEKRDRQLQDTQHNHTTMALLRRFIFITLHVHACRKRKNISFIKKKKSRSRSHPKILVSSHPASSMTKPCCT